MTSTSGPNFMTIFEQILSEHDVHPEKIQFRNLESVNEKLQKLIHDGPSNLQVITDFDFTLSKHHTKEKKCCPAADILQLNPIMSDDFKARVRERFDRLLPIELDPNLTIEQKTPRVIASFHESFSDLVGTNKLSKKTLVQMIDNLDENCNFELRDHCDTMLQRLYESEVPVLIFSAGYGDLIQGLLSKYDLSHVNIHVIGNFMDFSEDGDLIGFKEPLIHTFNKNESVIPSNCQYFQELSHRSNVILLGDSIGDASMAQGVHQPGAILKIGFLNEVNEQQLEAFLDRFDIVLLDDQTLDFVNYILMKISK